MSDSRATIGFDIGGTNTRALVLDTTNSVLATASSATPATGDALVDLVESMTTTLADELSVPRPAVGVGCAGTFDDHGQVLTSPNLGELVGYPLGAHLRRRLGGPLVVENDATAAAWAELAVGAGSGRSDLVFVTLGTGIGVGLILGGRLHRGAFRAAGEAGHMTVVHGGLPCGCGRRGCWEQYASGNAYGRIAREWAAAGRVPAIVERAAGAPAGVTSRLVSEMAAAAHPEALEIIDELALWVAVGVANLVNLLDPEAVVIGGGLAELGEVLSDAVSRRYLEVMVDADARPPVTITTTSLGPLGGAMGAAMLARDITAAHD